MANINEIIAGIGHEAHNTITFGAGGTTGAQGNITLFNVTGLVSLRIFAYCTQTLGGASATISVGTAYSGVALIAQTTATNITNTELWNDASPDAAVELLTTVPERIVNGNITMTIGTANITSGKLRFIVIWKPISPDGYVESAIAGGSASPSVSPSASASPSASVSPSASTSISPSASVSPSSSRSPSASSSVSQSPSSSRSPSASASPSPNEPL